MILFFSLILILSFRSEENENILKLRNRKHYSEEIQVARTDSGYVKLFIATYYQSPHCMNGMYSHELSLIFPDSSGVFELTGKKGGLRFQYGVSSIWEWRHLENPGDITGKIIIEKTKRKLIIQLEIKTVSKNYLKSVSYSGKRVIALHS